MRPAKLIGFLLKKHYLVGFPICTIVQALAEADPTDIRQDIAIVQFLSAILLSPLDNMDLDSLETS